MEDYLNMNKNFKYEIIKQVVDGKNLNNEQNANWVYLVVKSTVIFNDFHLKDV